MYKYSWRLLYYLCACVPVRVYFDVIYRWNPRKLGVGQFSLGCPQSECLLPIKQKRNDGGRGFDTDWLSLDVAKWNSMPALAFPRRDTYNKKRIKISKNNNNIRITWYLMLCVYARACVYKWNVYVVCARLCTINIRTHAFYDAVWMCECVCVYYNYIHLCVYTVFLFYTYVCGGASINPPYTFETS